jgi:phytoene dehydrogenase-like protein
LAKQKPDLKVLVLERRHIVGGAAITEEIIPGFKTSRASYVLSLLRPQIFDDLNIRKKIKLLCKDPAIFKPLHDGRQLMFGSDEKMNYEQIAKFSKKDANNFHAQLFDRLLDHPPFDPTSANTKSQFYETKAPHGEKTIWSLVKEQHQSLIPLIQEARRI